MKWFPQLRSCRRRLFLVALPAAAFLAGPTCARSEDVPHSEVASLTTAAAPALFRHVVLLGASVTAGFDSSQPFGGPKTIERRFSNFVESAIVGAHEPVATQANALLFMRAAELMEKQVAATVAAKPSLVIGVDALFWFCYGSGMTADQRMARFESGLRFLERIDAPLVIGDIPDASSAVGTMLDKDQMPELATIASCNERLKAWAATRKNVVLFPLATVMAGAQADEAVTISTFTWEKGKSRDLLESDRLHPSTHALAALAIAVLDAASGIATPPLPPTSICRDLDAVYAAGIARGATAPGLHSKATKTQN